VKLINSGSTRLVLLVGQYAIKIPRCCIKPDNKFYGKVIGLLEGWKANRYEYIWSKSNIHDFLCEVKYSFLFSLIIIMKKADKISRDEFFELKKFNFTYEHKIDSYGKINNKIKVVDYGN
jgi:hypothetical protein